MSWDHGPKRAKDDRCHDLLGMGYSPLLCLVAAVSRWVAENEPVTRIDVDELVSRVDGFEGVGSYLLQLCRLGYVVDVGKRGATHRRYYKPSDRGLRLVLEWTGAKERAA